MIRRHVTPALIAFLVLLGGCLLAPRLPGAWRVMLVLCGVTAAAALPALRLSRRAAILLFSVAVGSFLGAASSAGMDAARNGSYLPMPQSSVSEMRGVVTQDSSLSQRGQTVLHLSLRSAASAQRGVAADARGGVLLLIPGDHRFSIGQILKLRAAPADFDVVGADRFIARAELGSVRALGFTSPLWAFRAECRSWLHRAVSGAGYPASALMEALLVGSREDVPSSLYDGFLRTGSLHILALSGLHVTVIYGIVVGLLLFIRRKWVRFLIAAVVLLFYQFIAGFMPSLLRATVMIIVGGIALLIDRDREPLNALSLAGIVILLIDPFQAFTLSFQLSFLALLGILTVGPLIQRPLSGHVPRFLLMPLAMSVGAQVATLPLVVAQFGAYYPSGLAAGLLLVPLTTGFLWAGLAWLPLSLVSWPALHDLMGRGFDLLYRVTEGCAQIFARLPGVTPSPAAIPWIVGSSILVLVFLGVFLPRRSRPAAMGRA
jgi:competence protein ComEC